MAIAGHEKKNLGIVAEQTHADKYEKKQFLCCCPTPKLSPALACFSFSCHVACFGHPQKINNISLGRSSLEISKRGENKWVKAPKHWMRPLFTRRRNYQAFALLFGNSINPAIFPPAALQILWEKKLQCMVYRPMGSLPGKMVNYIIMKSPRFVATKNPLKPALM